MTRQELLEFAKEQTSIFPEDCYMGQVIRDYIEILEDKEYFAHIDDTCKDKRH